jgi:tripartite-type tricarboxylate transporter receptor subunit TctC
VHSKRSLIVALGIATATACAAAGAQQYPAKPVRVIVPFAPGGGADIVGRLIANKLSQDMGRQFIVDNRGGAGGLIGMEQTARAVPDGYTIMVISGSFTATSATHKTSFDPITAIVPVAEITSAPFALSVHPSLPSKTTAEFIALAKTPPEILDRLNAAVNKAVQDPEMKKQIDSQGMVGTGGTAAAFGDYIKKDYARWVKVVKEAGIKIE